MSTSGRPYDEPTFGRYVRTVRLEANKSLRQLASEIGISPTFLCEVENGQGRTLDEFRCRKLKEALPDIDLEQLFQLRDASVRALVFPSDDITPLARQLLATVFEAVFDGSLSDDSANELLHQLQALRDA